MAGKQPEAWTNKRLRFRALEWGSNKDKSVAEFGVMSDEAFFDVFLMRPELIVILVKSSAFISLSE